jgi:hypothetical protein
MILGNQSIIKNEGTKIMTLKSFKDFINEILDTTSVYKDFIKNFSSEDREFNFYYEKIKLNENEIFNLASYLRTFNNEDKKTLDDEYFGEAKYLRFLIFFNKNYTNDNPIDAFYIFVFNGNIAHERFTKMLDNSKRKYTPIENYKNVYYITYDDTLNVLNDTWCLPGVYTKDRIECWSSKNYMNFLFYKKLHKKLGFNDNAWKSIY